MPISQGNLNFKFQLWHKLIEQTRESSPVGSTNKCKIHDKGIKAFWAEDRQLLCIDCILSEIHKDHKLLALDKAVDNENKLLIQKKQSLCKLKMKFLDQQDELESKINLSLEKGKR